MRTLYVGNRNYSSWSMRGSLLLRQSRVACDEVVLPLDTEEGMAEIAAVSPSRRVPVLHYDGLVIWDTLAIAEFLNELEPAAGLWPKDAAARALARSVSAEMHAGFGELRSRLPLDVRGRHVVAMGDELRADIERIHSIWTRCRAAYGSGGEYLFGPWCAADSMFAPVVSRFKTYGVALPPVVREYCEAVWRWPAMASLVAEAAAEPWTLELGV
jgi:glutathione S-transferase